MEPEKKSNGALVGIVIVVIVLVVGGIYMWQSSKNYLNDVDVQTEPIATENNSNKSDNLQKEINANELDNLQKEIDTTDTNIDANAINSVQ